MSATKEVVTATPREGKFTKNIARRVRVSGKIPAVVYGAAQPSVAITVDPKQIQRILYSESGHNTIFDLDLSGAMTKVMIVDWQYEPIKGSLMHIDMKRIAMDKAIRVQVPIQLQGVPVGVKTQGGILDQILREVTVECLPDDIPSSISVDVTELAFGQVLRVADLPHGGKLKFLTDEDSAVAHITAVREEVVVTPDAAAVAATTTAEPEVAKKGKQETAEAAGDKGDKKDAKK
ncbi:MAG TPA: 50S ribosomal protein L25 [Acidobacteriaceae bacterium]|jgi:large subunit ribosomal protein L25|nr:50S ribosomal protein L25 [Acidobacteriaceae bacterium]